MHPEAPELPTLDEFVDDLQIDLYLNGLQMAAMLSAQLQAELANGPDENSLKKWYMWTRGLNQLQTFRYAPARQATREQKQRGRPAQEPKIHLNGPAPQLRKPATPKAATQPAPETMNAACAPSDPYVSSDPSDLYDVSGPNKARTSPVPVDRPAPSTNTAAAAAHRPPESQKNEKPRTSHATPTSSAKFDQLNTPAQKGGDHTLTPMPSGQFDQLNEYHASKRLVGSI